MQQSTILFAALLTCSGLLGCGGDPGAGPTAGAPEAAHPGSPSARPEIAASLREDLATPRHPSDGGGTVRLESARGLQGGALVAGQHARFELRYEAGPLGVAEGGTIYLQISPFWGWDTPQVQAPDGPGFTTVETSAEGVELLAATLDRQLLAVEVRGQALQEGETVSLVYGAGAAGARVDRYADREERLWLAVDGDGDGVRKLVESSPRVDIEAAPAAHLQVSWPTTARPGESIRITVAALDPYASAGTRFEGQVSFQVLELATEGSEQRWRPAPVDRHAFEALIRAPLLLGNPSYAATETVATTPGIFKLRASAISREGQELVAESSPLLVQKDAPRLLWADLHGHSNLSDGTGTPEDFYTYARHVAGLDVAALTDHDHWGLQFLDSHPQIWNRIQAAAEDAHDPGRFVTLPGYEWTSWLYGHRHVLYFEGSQETKPTGGWPLFSTLDPRYETPAQLWSALRGFPALTFAHHSAGGPVATDWSFAPPPDLEPVTEIVSIHGSSEAWDSPGRIYDPIRGNFVRDILDRPGYQLGFIGSGDSHDGHPGLAHLANPSGGLAALFAEERTRASVLDTLRRRHTYATNGARIFLDVSLAGHPMGTIFPENNQPSGETWPLQIEILATAPLDRVELIRGGSVTALGDSVGALQWRHIIDLRALEPGEDLYLRVIQSDGGAAWSSPIFGSPSSTP